LSGIAPSLEGVRGDRLLSILLLLQANGRMTAGDLGRRLEVSERTIYRDLDALSTAGVPVYAERGRTGGLALLEDFRTDLTGLTGEEARALFSFGGAPLVAQLGMGPELEGALRKLLAALPAAQRARAQRARGRLLVDPAPWMRPAEDAPHLAAIQEAVWEDRQLRLVYRHGTGDTVERVVDPYGLVAKAGAWYLLGAVAGSMRVFRVSRAVDVMPTGVAFQRPPGFELATAWDSQRSRFEAAAPGYGALVRLSAPVLPAFLRVAGAQLLEPAERLPAGADGWPRLRLRFRALGAARAVLLGFGPDVEALAPDELRRELASAAAGLVRLYTPGRTPPVE
jgi:predicted DNA-binding transcriptional regulator YafY